MLFINKHFEITLQEPCFWRQTGGCRWDGPREEHNDKICCDKILEGWSGYCECPDGTKKMKKGCELRVFGTCNEACGRDFTCRKLLSRLIKNSHNRI